MSDLAATLATAWDTLEAGIRDRTAPARHIVLATTSETGPEARILVLRGADRRAGTLTLHTDAATAKVAQLTRDPRATLLVWDPDARIQIRLRARVALRPGTVAEWEAVREPAVYGGTPAPGAPIPAPDAHDAAPDPTRFTVLIATVQEVETLRLGAAPHERARFTRATGYAGTWLAP